MTMRNHIDPKRFTRGLVPMKFAEPEEVEFKFRTKANIRKVKPSGSGKKKKLSYEVDL